MLKITLKAILLVLFVFYHGVGFGQTYNFNQYTLEQGLPQSTVFCILQDSRGFLWVGTEAGAARFDGIRFEVFDRSCGLPGNSVRGIVEDHMGRIWFGTDQGIGVFDGSDWKTIKTTDGLQGSTITKLLIDHQNRVWAATNDAGVNIITQSVDTLQIENINNTNGLSENFILDMMIDRDHTVWLAMIGGLNTVSISNNATVIKNINDSITLPSSFISSIEKDTDENIWLGTLDQGAFCWKKNSNTFISYQFANGITDNRIWDIMTDDDGSIWFASEKSGLYRLQNQTIQNIAPANGLYGNQMFCIYRDHNHNLWLGSVGQGLIKFQGFHFVHYSLNDGLPGLSVMAVKADTKNQLWLGTNQHGLGKATFENDKISVQAFNASSGYKSSNVVSIDFDNRGNLIAATRGLGMLRYENGVFNYVTVDDGLINNNINCIYNSPLGAIYVASDVGFNEIAGKGIFKISDEDGLINPEVQTVISDKNQNIWMGTLGGLAFFNKKTNTYRDFNEEEGLFDLSIHALVADKNNTLWIGTNNGIYSYRPETDTIIALSQVSFKSKSINSLLFINDTTLIAGTNNGFNKIIFDAHIKTVKSATQYDNTNGFKWSETNFNALCTDNKNHIWFGTVNGLTGYRPELEDTRAVLPAVHISGIRLSFEKVDWSILGYKTNGWNNYPTQLALPHNKNHVTFDFVGIYFKNPEKVIFKYKLEPYESDWSPSSQNRSVTYPGLSNGKYRFSIVASSDGINWSDPLVYAFAIKPPFWKTWWFLSSLGIFLILALIAFIRWRELKLRKEKIHLEKIVRQRTAEVIAQKTEIEKQKEEITSSITYAQRIQRAVLPGYENLQQNTDDCFILFKPRDIVSGDFYWIERIDNQLVVAAADCTGHGVPGAFMSMLGLSFMNKIIKEQKVNSPENVLAQMRSNVITSLKQGNYDGSSKDGMDMALCMINTESLMLTFAGAYNPAIIISGNDVNELKADRMPVGYHIVMHDYTPITLQLSKGDCIYLFSDGYQDQIGGPDGRKFMRKNLRELLVEIHHKPFCEQHDILNETIEAWRNHPQGKTDQMDDIVVVGFRV